MKESKNQNKRSLRRFHENKDETVYDDYLEPEDLVLPKESVPISIPQYTTQKPRVLYTTSESKSLQTKIPQDVKSDMLIFRLEDLNMMIGMSNNLERKMVETIARYPKVIGYNVSDTMTAVLRKVVRNSKNL